MSFGVQSAFAESNSPKATVKNNVVTFSNLDQLKANEKLAIAVVDSNGDGSHLFAEEYTPEGENLMKVIPMEL